MEEVVQGELNGVLPIFGEGCGFPHLAKLNLRHDSEHVFLALEVVKKSAFAYVRCLGDVFHCDVGESAFGKELEGAAEEGQAGFRCTALTAAHVFEMRQMFSGGWSRRFCSAIGVTLAHK
jgi:hypothetical protein